ncbi:MAG: AraC family transcriptional regulator [Verrucomicrobiota bacterium]
MTRKATPSAQDGIVGGEHLKDASYDICRPGGSGDWLLLFTLRGGGLLLSSAGQSRIPAGHAALFAPGEYQHYQTDPELRQWDLIWSHFHPRPHALPQLDLPTTKAGHRVVDGRRVAPSVERALRTSYLTLQRGLPFAENWSFHLLEEALLLLAATSARNPQSHWDPRIRQAVALLGERMTDPPPVEKLAAEVGLSLSRFSELFRDTVGTSPLRYAEQLRLRHARNLLVYSAMRIHEVAEACGYEDPYYFSTRYRKTYGHPPTSERKR